ncbi:MAG: thioesterase family protein [Spirochaetia bacterium]|nr:thioesterase family protein [Spirochaetia bacterium]
MDNPFFLQKEIEIQGYDIDYGGVVSNIVYIRWMDDLRTALLKDHYSLALMAKNGLAPVVNKTHAHYKRPALFGDSLIAKIRITMLEKIRWEVQVEITKNGGETVFTAVQSGAFVNLKNGRPVPVPAILADKWKEYQTVL